MDEAWRHLSSCINLQSCRYWAAENPLIQEHVLHSDKISVWWAISDRRIVGPIIFYYNVSNELYGRIFAEFVEQLYKYRVDSSYFQQDSNLHTTHLMVLVTSFFEDRIVSNDLRPYWSPVFNSYDFYLSDILKDRVHASRPSTLVHLRDYITWEINNKLVSTGFWEHPEV